MESADSPAAEIDRLSEAIARTPDDAALHFERGRLYYKQGYLDKALNDFIRVRQLDPAHTEAAHYEAMLKEIFAFRHMDMYNP